MITHITAFYFLVRHRPEAAQAALVGDAAVS
jgi:hypothetical protein